MEWYIPPLIGVLTVAGSLSLGVLIGWFTREYQQRKLDNAPAKFKRRQTQPVEPYITVIPDRLPDGTPKPRVKSRSSKAVYARPRYRK
jgi:hypothetical protein